MSASSNAERKCETCDKLANYKLTPLQSIKCNNCGKKMETEVFLICGKRCKGLSWTFDSWGKDLNPTKVDLFMEDNECNHCGVRNDPCATFFREKLETT
jgi:hypothetical protein